MRYLDSILPSFHRSVRSAFLPLWPLFLVDIIAVLVAAVVGHHQGYVTLYFGEDTPITYLSIFQLLAISWVTYRLRKIRRTARPSGRGRNPSLIWAIISFGFLFLALDERFSIHESLDHNIHDLFGMAETGVSDRIDDLIIAFYGLVALGVLYRYREELVKFRQIWPLLAGGFGLLFMMVLLDVVTNRDDLLSMWLSAEQTRFWKDGLSVLEEQIKLLGEACFLSGFYLALTIARQSPPS